MRTVAIIMVLHTFGAWTALSAVDVKPASPKDVSIELAHDSAYSFAEGLDATIDFVCDLDRIGKANFANLVTKGKDYKDGYSVMVRKDGSLLVYLRGVQPAYKIVRLGLESGKRYSLRLCETKGLMRIFVNGKEDELRFHRYA